MHGDMFQRIAAFLDDCNAAYEVFEHDHVHSSEDAARVRGTALEESAKALVLQAKSGRIFQCVVGGHRRLDLRKIKALTGEKNCSLAHPDTVLSETGCPVGTVPPFANLFEQPLEMYADEELFAREKIVFSAGSHYRSIRMDAQEWAELTGARREDIGKDQ